ncbi:hypothetical protein [Clostridium sp.]|uniref:hypothetical protein n=1 Tax=Clostridium sp. TaxID=1506 RepID=UPI003F39CE7A
MKIIKKYKVIVNEDVGEFQREFNKYLQKYQDAGYELDIKYTIAISKNGGLIRSVMILCY